MLKLRVTEMTCGGCESKVRRALARVPGIEKLEIDRDQKLVGVSGPASPDVVIQALEGVGFTAEKLAA
jgi:copper chaperone CopZ